MKKYKLNQAYIDHQTEIVKVYGGNLNDTLQLAEQRLNEQADDCKGYIKEWALQGKSVREIHDILVDWNNHTLANHMEVVRDIYNEATNNIETLCENGVCDAVPPTLTCVEDLCEMVGCDIKHELSASLKVEGMLNYLTTQGVIKEYNAERLDYLFGNDEPY